MGDFEARLRRELADVGDRYVPDPNLAHRIAAHTRRRARQRRVGAASALVVALLAALGTSAALGVTSRSPRHARVDGVVAGTTSPEGSGPGGAAGTHHAKRSTTSSAPTGNGTHSSTGSGANGAPGPTTGRGGGASTPTSTPRDTHTTATSRPSTTRATPDTTPPPSDTAPTSPPITDTTSSDPAAPTVTITGPPCPPVGTSTFTATATGTATVTWSNGQTGPQAAYTFATPGSSTISATATDGAGRSSTTTYAVAVGATC
jgi:hypothetical protein